MNRIEYEVALGEDEILDRGVFCIFCKDELVRTKRVKTLFRHLSTGRLACDRRLRARRRRDGAWAQTPL